MRSVYNLTHCIAGRFGLIIVQRVQTLLHILYKGIPCTGTGTSNSDDRYVHY